MNRRFGGRLVGVRVARFRAHLPDSKRPSRENPYQKSAVRCPTPAVVAFLKSLIHSKSLEKLARVVARLRGQPASKEEDSETSDETRHYVCRSPHGLFRDHDSIACAF